MRTINVTTVIVAMLLLGASTGCIAINVHRDVTFELRDGDTGAPVAGGTVALGYDAHPLFWNHPRDRTAIAGAAGIVKLPIVEKWYGTGPN